MCLSERDKISFCHFYFMPSDILFHMQSQKRMDDTNSSPTCRSASDPFRFDDLEEEVCCLQTNSSAGRFKSR